MGGSAPSDGSTYSPRIAFVYVFNLIVGTGALALPSVLTSGGWILGTLFLALVALSSYVAVTFMIESMASANAILALNKVESEELVSLSDSGIGSEDERSLGTSTSASSKGVTARETSLSPLKSAEKGASVSAPPPQSLSPSSPPQTSGTLPGGIPPLSLGGPGLKMSSSLFEIVHRTEMGQMADLFFNETGRIFFYVALIAYLYGDATIYCTFIPRSLVGFMYGKNAPPWAFDLFLALFVVVIVPFCFFDFQKTKPLQLTTLVIRNVALITMMVLSLWLVYHQGTRTKGVPDFNIRAVPNLFGGAVYAFMCHHSLPGIITPMRDKAWVSTVLKSAFIAVFSIYLLLFLSCGFAFGLSAEDPITFNFLPSKFGLVGDFLYLFPVFTLSSNYPILTITLRNNLDTLLHLLLPKGSALLPAVGVLSSGHVKQHRSPADVHSCVTPPSLPGRHAPRHRRLIVTLVAVGPPILCCLLAEHADVDVSSLVGLTGAYAGAAVMLIIPACLVSCSRLVVNQELQGSAGSKAPMGLWSPNQANHHASPFKGLFWVVLLILFAICAMTFITLNEVFDTGFT